LLAFTINKITKHTHISNIYNKAIRWVENTILGCLQFARTYWMKLQEPKKFVLDA
jgi:hypothetical protein